MNVRLRWVAVPVAGLALVAGCASSQTHAATGDTTSSTGQTQAAGWSAPSDATTTAQKAGLKMLGSEQLQVHYHAHLDVVADGQNITVPADLGIDLQRQTITELHTHDTSGVVHIESAADTPFTLGQLFTEWGQPLTAQQVGPVHLSPTEVLHVYDNGKPVSGDPATLVFRAHHEITVWVGPSDQTPHPASSYAFPGGL